LQAAGGESESIGGMVLADEVEEFIASLGPSDLFGAPN